jgi:hypothetical protein
MTTPGTLFHLVSALSAFAISEMELAGTLVHLVYSSGAAFGGGLRGARFVLDAGRAI